MTDGEGRSGGQHGGRRHGAGRAAARALPPQAEGGGRPRRSPVAGAWRREGGGGLGPPGARRRAAVLRRAGAVSARGGGERGDACQRVGFVLLRVRRVCQWKACGRFPPDGKAVLSFPEKVTGVSSRPPSASPGHAGPPQ